MAHCTRSDSTDSSPASTFQKTSPPQTHSCCSSDCRPYLFTQHARATFSSFLHGPYPFSYSYISDGRCTMHSSEARTHAHAHAAAADLWRHSAPEPQHSTAQRSRVVFISFPPVTLYMALHFRYEAPPQLQRTATCTHTHSSDNTQGIHMLASSYLRRLAL